MPNPGDSLHLAQLDYYFTIDTLIAAAGPVTFSAPDPVRFTFPFETGSTQNLDGSVTVTWDYSWFTQSDVETDLVTALNEIVGSVAVMLGLSSDQVSAAVTVRRVWTYAPNVQGAGVGTGRISNQDVMVYPPVVVTPG